VGLEVADDDVDTLGAESLGLFEHAVGLADAGGISQVNLKMAGTLHGETCWVRSMLFNAETQRAQRETQRKRRTTSAKEVGEAVFRA
jgi:hypothetical protein